MNKAYNYSILIFAFLTSSANSFATTWNEPWADKVISAAGSFVFAHITSYDEDEVRIRIEKQLGGEQLPKEIRITGFYLLDLTSMSGGHGPEFHFGKTRTGYFFIKKNDKGQYCIATPTTGFDLVNDGVVHATYRHSYHQAGVPIQVYETTMTAIFNHYHNLPYNKKDIYDFIDLQLSKAPAGFDEHEIKTFFLQHVALELIFHLRLQCYFEKVIPFLNDAENFHNRVSAARALIACDTNETRQILYDKIAQNKDDDFTTVICIWTLKELKPKELKQDLKNLLTTASTEGNGFGGNIMDPRVGTDFPDVKSALADLVNSL